MTVRLSVMLFSNMLYKLQGFQDMLVWVNWGQFGSVRFSWGQVGPSGHILNAFLKYALQVKGPSVYFSLGQLGQFGLVGVK